MKKIFLFCLAILCSLVFLWVPQTAQALDITRGEIIASSVAFRKAPDANSAIISKLAKGALVDILQTNVNAQWDKVQYKGKTGYVNRVYISWDLSLDAYKLDYTGTVINCKTDIIVRSTPSSKANVVGTAKKGTSLKVTQKDCAKGWHQVEFEGGTAYISADYLEVIPKVDDTQLSSLTIKGGTLAPSFSPAEYGYVVSATSAKVTFTAKANSGVTIDINGSGKSSLTISVPSPGMKTIRIDVNGKTRYSLYIARSVITMGTWNIKRGDGNLLMQGRLVRDQQLDIIGIQEAFQHNNASDIVDNLASLKTINMPYTKFAPTIDYSDGSQFGIGILSHYKLSGFETFTLESDGHEKRILQKAVAKINGKTVSIYNTHFSYEAASTREKQFAKVVSVMKKDKNKYKILFGDFNAKADEFSQFQGFTITHTTQTAYYDYSGNPIDINIIDNIIVTKNIQVINSRIIATKLSDHDPFFAYMVLK